MNGRLLVWSPCLLVALLGSLACACAETTAREVEEDNSVVPTLVTPHKAWGRGYARGPVRALFFVYTGAYDGTWEDTGTRVREVAELAQRFDLQADAALFCGSDGAKGWTFHGGKLGADRAERLLARPYQLYVIAGFPMSKLPAKLQYLILEQVARGAGLLCCGPAGCEYMTPRRRMDPVPPALVEGVPVLDNKPPEQWVSAFRMKQGRGVWLRYNANTLTPSHPFTWRGLAEYDYWMLLVGRAALWAAARDSEITVAGVMGGKPALLNQTAAARAEITLGSKAVKPTRATAALELRRADDGVTTSLGETTTMVAPGKGTVVAANLPRLRAGDYFVDAIVRTDRGVEGFGAGTLTVASDYGIDAVTMDQRFVERGEVITGKVTVRGAVPAKSVVRVRLRDSYDRVLRQQDYPVVAGQTQYPVEYRPDFAATILMRAEGALLADGDEVEMKSTSFTVPKRRRGQLNFVMWDGPHDVLGYYAWRKLQEAGMNTCLLGSMGGERAQPPAILACDASLVPYSTRILDEKDDKGYMKPVCWNDEPAVTQYVQKIVDNQKRLREQGVFTYSLGDEGVTRGCCVSPACLDAYRRYLAAQYGTIDKLNASWGATYKSFDEVNLLSAKDNTESGALQTCYPRWYDRQAFARYNLMQFSGRFVEAYKRLDPEAVTGFEGTGGFGDDYDAILGINTFYGPYPSIGDDIVRSAAPRQLIRSNWMGYSKTPDALSDAAWRMVMKGMDSIWYWMWSGIGSWRGYLTPCLDYWPAIAELTDEMKPVREGLGDLILQSEVSHSKIAVLYSLPSALSCQLENGREFIAAETAHQTWTQLTYDVGRDFRYVTSAMLKRGALDPREFRVLLLPMTQAVGPEEAEAIRRFAEAGGTVIADVRPGIYDGHCKPATPGVLDDLFGIQRTGRGKAADVAVTIQADLAGQSLDLKLGTGRVDTQVQPGAARALAMADKTPLLLVNPVGAGHAVLLNLQLLVSKPEDAPAVAARQFVRALYEAYGARSAIEFSSPDGGPLPMCETRIWNNGNARLFGLWRQMQCAWFSPRGGTVAGAPVPAKITLPAAQHVYDLRAHKYLGEVARVDTALRWGRASFFLALPYPIKGTRVELSSAAPAAGEVLTASVRLDIPATATEKHAVWVEVTDPRGQHPLWGRQVLMLAGGAGEVQLPVAFNDLPGQWKIKATELFSGQAAEATWTVRG